MYNRAYERKNHSNRRYRGRPSASGRRRVCRVAGVAFRLVLHPAHRVVDYRARRRLACCAGAVRRLPVLRRRGLFAGMGGRRGARDDGRVERRAMRNKLLGVGIAGSAVAALCCFTPVLVWFLAVFGLSAYAGYLDPILLPALLVFLAITGYAIWRRRKHR